MSYGWSEISGEMAHGPFETMEELVEDALDYLNPDQDIQIEVGKCRFAAAECYIHDDVNEVLEQLDDAASDNEYGFYDDQIFTIQGNENEAQDALTKALTEWARKYVTSSVWCLDETEKMTIKARKREDDHGDATEV